MAAAARDAKHNRRSDHCNGPLPHRVSFEVIRNPCRQVVREFEQSPDTHRLAERALQDFLEGERRDSNPRPPGPQPGAEMWCTPRKSRLYWAFWPRDLVPVVLRLVHELVHEIEHTKGCPNLVLIRSGKVRRATARAPLHLSARAGVSRAENGALGSRPDRACGARPSRRSPVEQNSMGHVVRGCRFL